MTLHELATNAVKYGAWSKESGQVRVECKHEVETGRMQLLWSERGGPPVAPPTHRGFGSRLISSAMNGEPGIAKMDFNPGGLVCVLEIAVGNGLAKTA